MSGRNLFYLYVISILNQYSVEGSSVNPVPEIFSSFLSQGLIGKAIEARILEAGSGALVKEVSFERVTE